ncbi:hypothetical protein [Streptomyces sp. NPDC003006]
MSSAVQPQPRRTARYALDNGFHAVVEGILYGPGAPGDGGL